MWCLSQTRSHSSQSTGRARRLLLAEACPTQIHNLRQPVVFGWEPTLRCPGSPCRTVTAVSLVAAAAAASFALLQTPLSRIVYSLETMAATAVEKLEARYIIAPSRTT